MRRDSRRANGSVGEIWGQQSEPVCFKRKKKLENKRKKKNMKICPHLGTHFYPQICTRNKKNDDF